MKDYIKIARVDHWIKQLFIVPGMIVALFLTRNPITAAVVKVHCSCTYFDIIRGICQLCY